MFTGIVQEVGTVVGSRSLRGARQISVQAPLLSDGIESGESVAVNGVCLSVVNVRGGVLYFDVVPETARLTTMGSLRAGLPVNLERSLSLADRLNGHVVLGHVDGVGTVLSMRNTSNEVALHVRVPANLRKYLVPKGSIALDGVSLTIGARLPRSGCLIYLIPETLRRTTLGKRKAGDKLNVEVDYLVKIVSQAAAIG